jgi:hypothetical protein
VDNQQPVGVAFFVEEEHSRAVRALVVAKRAGGRWPRRPLVVQSSAMVLLLSISPPAALSSSFTMRAFPCLD